MEEQFSFVDLPPLLTKFLNHLKVHGKSAHTISAYKNDLSTFCEFLTHAQVSPDCYTYPVQDNWIYYLQENGRHSQASLRRAQMSVRTFLHFLVSENVISQSPFLEIKSLKHPVHSYLTVPHDKFHFICEKLQELALRGDEKAVRDLALILILGECGLKASEAAALSWGDLILSSPESYLKVSGKNERLVPYSAEVSQALNMLKKTRQDMDLSTEIDAKLFFGYLNISRKTFTHSLHRHGIKFVIYEVCTEICGIPYNSESLRNHAILRWISQNMTKEKIADLAGYQSLNSLERFLNCMEHKKTSRRKKTKA